MRASAQATAGLFILSVCAVATLAPALPLVRLADANMPVKGPNVASATSVNYVQNAAEADVYAIAAAQVADRKAHSPRVRNFADMMLRDHTSSDDQLKAVVWRASINVTPPTVLDHTHAAMLQSLNSASGTDFDRRYALQQVEAQESALLVHTDYARSGDNDLLRAYAADAAPRTEAHLALARDLSLKAGAQLAFGQARKRPHRAPVPASL